jgi:hypothetical protein
MQNNQIELAQKLAGDKLNWNYLFQRSRINWVLPLIYKNLLKLNSIIPADIIEQFKTTYILQSLNNERRYQDLSAVLKALNSQKIPTVLHKGAVLAEIIYQDIAFRPMSDFDFLVRPKDWPKIVEILSALGYALSAHKNISRVAKEYHLSCVNQKRTGLEFKFNLYWLDIPEFKEESVWTDALPAKIAQENTLIPSCEDHLLILSLNLFRHRYYGLIWFCDIHELIRHYKTEINWERLLKKAREKRVSSFLYYGLFLTRQLLGIEMPPEIFKRLRPNYLRRKLFVHFHIIDNIITLKGQTEEIRSSPQSQLLQLFLIDKLRFHPKILLKTISYFLKTAFPYPEATALSKFHIYYLERFKKLYHLCREIMKKIF